MISFTTEREHLLLEYSPINGTSWIFEEFEKGNSIHVKKTYLLSEDMLFQQQTKEEGIPNSDMEEKDEDSVLFIVAELESDYFRFDKRVFGIQHELLIHKSVKFRDQMFSAYRNISIPRRLFKILQKDLIIGERDNELPINEFENLINTFPNSNETRKYVDSRVCSILREYFDIDKDHLLIYNNLLNNLDQKLQRAGIISKFASYEVEKYTYILDKLNQMMKDETGYSEKSWQNEILQIILLVYPKYICVLDEVTIRDVYTRKNRRVDYVLVDANGNIDIAEIKKPSDSPILSSSQYRQNYVPRRDLSGTIMQIEKYVYLLNKWGRPGEKKLTERYKSVLPDNLEIHITNPAGIVIMGKEKELKRQQMSDLEIIKRKYKNIVDILTYEDLIKRLEKILQKFNRC